MNVCGEDPNVGAVSELIEKTISSGSDAEFDIDTVSVLVGAKREHCKLVVLDEHVAAVASIAAGISILSW